MSRFILAAALALGATACSQPAPPAAEVPVVKTLVVSAQATQNSRSYSGETHARHEIPLAFRIGGKLAERKVDAGAHVAAGQLLARLDPADVALQAAQAQSQLALADADARRYRDLRAQNFVSIAALETKETALKAAQSQAGIARNQAAYAQLSADRAGAVVAVLAEPGQVLAAGQPVLRLAEDGEREVAISVPETAVRSLKVGDAAEVTLWSGGKTYRGRLRELAPAADATMRTFAVRVTLVDADDAVPLGLTATVRFTNDSPPALAVPLAALFQQGERAAVWVVGADETLSLRPVKVASYTDRGATLAEGVREGERIVAAGVHKLVVGQKVRLAP